MVLRKPAKRRNSQNVNDDDYSDDSWDVTHVEAEGSNPVEEKLKEDRRYAVFFGIEEFFARTLFLASPLANAKHKCINPGYKEFLFSLL